MDTDDQRPSLRDIIRNAAQGDGEEAATGAATMEAGDDGEAAGASQTAVGGEGQDAPEKAEKPADGGRARDEKGKFLKPPGAADNQTSEQPRPGGEADPQDEPIRVPPSLPAPLKAKFSELPKEWRDAFWKRDEEVNTAKAQWDGKAAKFNRLEEILSPHRDAWAMQGIPDDVAAIQALVTAERRLREDAPSALRELARAYGVTPQHLQQIVGGAGAAPQQGAQPQQGQVPPQFLTEFQALKQRVDQYDANSEAERQNSARAEIDAFRADPANLYFEDVRERMAALINAGQAKTLKEAYDMATWADPQIRPLLQRAASAQERARQVQESAKEKAAKAAKAGGSVVGAPAGGGSSGAGGAPKPLKQIIREAGAAQETRVA